MKSKTYPIKFIKSFDKKKVGDIVECSKKNCERLIENGYARYVDEPKKLKKKIIKKKPIIKREIKTPLEIESILKSLVGKSPLEQDELINKLSKEEDKTKKSLRETLRGFQKEQKELIKLRLEILKEEQSQNKKKKPTIDEEAKWLSDLETLKAHTNKFQRDSEGLLKYDTKEGAEGYMNVSIENSDRFVSEENDRIRKENKIQKTKDKVNDWAYDYKNNPVEVEAEIKEFAKGIELYSNSDLKKLVQKEIKHREEVSKENELKEKDRKLKEKREKELESNFSKKEILLPKSGKLISSFAEQVSEIMKDKNKIFFRVDSMEIVEINIIKDDENKESYMGFISVLPRRFITLIENYMVPGNDVWNETFKRTEFLKKSITGELANTLLSSEILQKSLPKIERLFSVPLPILHKDKLTFPIKGYDKRFNSWLNFDSPEITNQEMKLEEAKEILYNLFKEFCFQSHQDYINAIAALLTPYLRGLFSQFNTRTPVWVYIANRERAGKDYLAGITGMLYEGHCLEEPPICNGEKSSNNDELKKKILAAMISGRKRLHFANNKGFLNNAVFEAVITAEKYSDRILGRNEILTFDNELDFSMSGNMGIGFTPDFANRARFIRLFLDIEDANSRSFNNPNLHKFVKDNRELILSALYSLIKNWVDKGKPKGSIPFTSFPEWAEICGGIMEAAGYDTPCNQDKEILSFGGDNETKDMKRLFELGYEKHPDVWIKRTDIKRLIIDDDDLFGYFDFTKRSDQTKFGNKLVKFIGRVFSDVRLIVEDSSIRGSRQEYKFTKEVVETDKMKIFEYEVAKK